MISDRMDTLQNVDKLSEFSFVRLHGWQFLSFPIVVGDSFFLYDYLFLLLHVKRYFAKKCHWLCLQTRNILHLKETKCTYLSARSVDGD